MSSSGTINILVFLVMGFAAQHHFAEALNCSSAYYRYPENSDIIVNCGPTTIELTINACPVQYAQFDPNQLALNGQHSNNACLAILDSAVDPPVVRYTFPINDTTANACGNSILIEDSQGSGIFSAFSIVQTVVISGFVDTPQLREGGLISYSTDLNYTFSCQYPLQYLLNNTELLTASANVAINYNNGSFLSTLSMELFTDAGFLNPLQFNGTALQLKKKIYVQVSATNLTANFNVLLDQCFATPSPLITTTPAQKESLLTGCTTQNRTIVLLNGVGKVAQFSFETFRFLQYSNQQTSPIYLHCITRLCQPGQCAQYLQSCTNTNRRRKRAVDQSLSIAQETPNPVTVSSGPIYTTDQVGVAALFSSQSSSMQEAKQLEGTLTGLIVGLVIAAILGTALVFASVLFFKMYRLRASQKNGVDNFGFSGK
ncbi:zona pellucida-like domain-containing protein 1 [Pelodytes ibericus]